MTACIQKWAHAILCLIQECVFLSKLCVVRGVCATGCVCLWFMFEYSWRIVFYCAWAQKATKCLLYALHTDSHSVQSKRIDQLHSIFWLIGLNTIEKLLVLVSCSFLSIYSRSFRPSLSDCHQKCTYNRHYNVQRIYRAEICTVSQRDIGNIKAHVCVYFTLIKLFIQETLIDQENWYSHHHHNFRIWPIAVRLNSDGISVMMMYAFWYVFEIDAHSISATTTKNHLNNTVNNRIVHSKIHFFIWQTIRSRRIAIPRHALEFSMSIGGTWKKQHDLFPHKQSHSKWSYEFHFAKLLRAVKFISTARHI